MSEFLFLYRGGQRASEAAESDKVMQKWVAWMEDLGSKGHLKDRGQPLEPAGKVVRGKSKDVTDGYTLITARDLTQAAELSKGCPIFDTDGVVEVRPVMEM